MAILLEKYPYLQEQLEEAGITAQDLVDNFKNVNSVIETNVITFDDYVKRLKNIDDSITAVESAISEFNESGSISYETFSSLKEAGLLEYLKVTENGIVANTQALYNQEAALKEAFPNGTVHKKFDQIERRGSQRFRHATRRKTPDARPLGHG